MIMMTESEDGLAEEMQHKHQIWDPLNWFWTYLSQHYASITNATCIVNKVDSFLVSIRHQNVFCLHPCWVCFCCLGLLCLLMMNWVSVCRVLFACLVVTAYVIHLGLLIFLSNKIENAWTTAALPKMGGAAPWDTGTRAAQGLFIFIHFNGDSPHWKELQ